MIQNPSVLLFAGVCGTGPKPLVLFPLDTKMLFGRKLDDTTPSVSAGVDWMASNLDIGPRGSSGAMSRFSPTARTLIPQL